MAKIKKYKLTLEGSTKDENREYLGPRQICVDASSDKQAYAAARAEYIRDVGRSDVKTRIIRSVVLNGLLVLILALI